MFPADHRLSSKRKWEDDDYADLVSVRMRKDEIAAVHSLATAKYQFSNSTVGESRRSASMVQFFVKTIPATRGEPSNSTSVSESLVIQANLTDSVRSVHEKIEARTGVPMDEQRLIYRGKQLEWDKTLQECSIENDAGLQLVGRMRSTEYPLAWQAIDSMMLSVRDMSITDLRNKVCKFLKSIPKSENNMSAASHFQIFLSSPVPAALVMLYLYSNSNNKAHAKEMIMSFVKPKSIILDESTHTLVAPIVLEFCKLFNRQSYDGALYRECRSSLASYVKTVGVSSSTKNIKPGMPHFEVKDCFPFVREVASDLSVNLLPTSSLPGLNKTLESNVCDFTAFVHPLQKAIMKQVKLHGPIALPIQRGHCQNFHYVDEMGSLHFIFMDLLSKINNFLQRMEVHLASRKAVVGDDVKRGLPEHLAILKALDGLAKLFLGSENLFWTLMRLRKFSVCNLIIKHVNRSEDNLWLMGHEDVTNFECRRHLVMMMLPEGDDDYEDQQEMLIDRANILEESFEYIGKATPFSLHSGLFLEFKNEEATGPGVVREWFFLVCQALFNPQNALFVACPDDRRRFYPNPASKVNPLHLEYFSFCGRLIALALMHKVQIGIVFDRVFFVQLAGRSLSLEDMRDADPCLYNSCKQVLGMDVEFIDSDGLGLTFVREIEELGSRKIVELCPGGKFRVVNSRNRDLYVTLLIQHRFVRSIEEQVSHFSQGFADILLNSDHQKPFFRSLTLEDFDLMLRGNESPICVQDWKLHTKYNGYKESSRQIVWFWKILGEMSAEQRKTLLFFWTSVKFLPLGGFSGFAAPLHIYKTKEPHDRLPSSHTCFLRLSFPAYPSINVMRRRFNIITQEHIGYSFGSF